MWIKHVWNLTRKIIDEFLVGTNIEYPQNGTFQISKNESPKKREFQKIC